MPKIGLKTAKYIVDIIAAEAGAMLMDYFPTGKYHEVVEKIGLDFTAQVEREVGDFIVRQLKENFPVDTILMKEPVATITDYARFAGAQYCWVVDPLDGDINFSRGDKNFSVSIGLLKNGSPVLGVVYVPVEKNLYSAQIDQDGAFLNGKRIKVSKITELKKTVVAYDWSLDPEAMKVLAGHIQSFAGSVLAVKSMGSPCADLCKLAEGRIDAYIHTDVKPWNVIASVLICIKAGAGVTHVSGRWWQNPFEQTIFVANNRETEHAIKDLMYKHKQ